ncbi:LEAF RUST 10 DISEASE-RESISTANCE LOCUS RECEPTOR-LIKE PROTEIN KINASE-like 2.1 [Carica papaya]|uniref:LEAF RUST 10 DISEASE-RESISTANCE LOCUS RECEPTOR-LIKE PROTEIN KINASE-like 2.1 n=1 Tax=Carica papaya TaxID=3649 RepID=UPI000B8D0122|nr:LEAF RUST 10 DISEASE-RESISTANCE LOCUS RECEPTOR-LIKE PROTEIN KINASE-like 2.1 [Carica papaya]
MNLHLPSTKLLFLTTITVFLIYIPASAFAADDRFLNCSRLISCGDVQNIGYPFWGWSRPEYCGFPGFELSCSDDHLLVIRIMDLSYQVIRIDNQSQSLTVARLDYLENLCPNLLFNTTLNTTLFSFSSDKEDVRLYYNCSLPTSAANVGLPFEFRCDINGTDDLLGYFMMGLTPDVVSAVLGSCENSVIIPANRSLLINQSSDNLVNVLRAGFGLTWSANNTWCQHCEAIGGRCGFNNTSTCFCENQICDQMVNESIPKGIYLLFLLLSLLEKF